MARFDCVRVVEDYLHIWSTRSSRRLTISLEEHYPGHQISQIGRPKLLIRQQVIEWPESKPLAKPIHLSQLISPSTDSLGLSDPVKIPLSSIAGIHPEILKICDAADAALPIGGSIPEFQPAVIERLTDITPLILHRFQGRLYVVGSLNIYRAARKVCEPETEIMARIHELKMGPRLRLIIENEVLVAPLIFSQASTPKTIFRIHQWMRNAKNYVGLGAPLSLRGFARWGGFDVRKLK